MSVYSRKLQRILCQIANCDEFKKVVARKDGSLVAIPASHRGRPTGKRLMARARRVTWMRMEYRHEIIEWAVLKDAARKRIMDTVLQFRRNRK